MAILEVQHLVKRFGNNEVLKDISFSLEKGQVLSIIGSSGSGKTTLLRCLNFLETPNAGKITVNGDTIYDEIETGRLSDKEIRNRRLHFGLVFQNFNLFPQYTALQNVTLARSLMAKEDEAYKENKDAILSDITEQGKQLLDQVGLSDRMDFYPCQLSGGQQQRVAIARALAMKPEILCFDEPTSALDPELTGEVLRVIRNLKSSDRTMVIVTHEMTFAYNVSDYVIFMDKGYIVEAGTPQEVFDHPKTERMKAFIAGHEKE